MPKLRLAALLIVAAAGSVPPFSATATEAGDAARGERVFQRCYACHSVKPNEGNLQGPSLYKILGRPAAALPGFDYSEAMKQRAAEGLTWDAASLEAYIADPEAVVPGTLMSIPPLRDARARADLIAFLALSGPFQD